MVWARNQPNCFIGTDLVELSRIRKLYLRHSEQFMDSLCSAAEKKSVSRKRNKILCLAQYWVAKEAVYKLLQTSLDAGIGWKEISVVEEKKGQFKVQLFGKAKKRALELNIRNVLLSLSCPPRMVAALAVAVRLPI